MFPARPPLLERAGMRYALIIAALLFALGSLVALGLSFQAGMANAVRDANREDRRAPFSYSAATYPLDPPRLCVNVGDTLTFTSTLEISDVPVVVTRYRTIWGFSQKRTMWRDSDTPYAVWTEASDVVTPISLPVPTLPPGPYEVRVAGQGVARNTAVYTVPFIVCGGGT